MTREPQEKRRKQPSDKGIRRKKAGKRARRTLSPYSLEATAAGLAPGVRCVMAELLVLYGDALDRGALPWNTAPPLESLLGKGFTQKDLAALRKQGSLEAATVKQLSARFGSRFDAAGRARGTKLVALTAAGAKLARRAFRLLSAPAAGTVATGAREELPSYKSKSRRLLFRGVVVREIAHRAPDQEALLTAFEECGWPRVMDDPLTGVAGRIARKHLLDTVKNLNRKLRHAGVRFGVSGNGTQVFWEAEGRKMKNEEPRTEN